MGAAILTPGPGTNPHPAPDHDPYPHPTPSPYANPTPNPNPTSSLSLGLPTPLPSTSSFSPGSLAAGLLLAALAAAALVMARRRRRSARLVEILESASLGPKRAIVVARLGDEILVLGSSEGGIALLSTRPAAGLVNQVRSAGACPPLQGEGFRDTGSLPRSDELRRAGAPPPPQTARGRVLDLLSRLKPQKRAATPAFETALTESLEDLELRRKLAAGLAGQAGAGDKPPRYGCGGRPPSGNLP